MLPVETSPRTTLPEHISTHSGASISLVTFPKIAREMWNHDENISTAIRCSSLHEREFMKRKANCQAKFSECHLVFPLLGQWSAVEVHSYK